MKTRNLSILIALSCISASAAANYDLLGRKGSQMNSPMVYKNVNYKAPKGSLEESILAKQGLDNGITAIDGIYEGSFYDGTKDNFAFYVHKKNSVKLITSNTQYTTNFTPVLTKKSQASISNIIGESKYGQTNTNNYVLDWNSLSGSRGPALYANENIDYTYAYDLRRLKSFKGYEVKSIPKDSIGIYIKTNAVPNGRAISYVDLNSSNCSYTPNTHQEFDATQLAFALRDFSARNTPYIANDQCSGSNPKSPELRFPQILIGLHTQKDYYDVGSATDNYTSKAQALDNYIYANHTVEIVGAGNFGDISIYGSDNSEGSLAEEAHSVNAITVGSVNTDNYIENSSSWVDPKYSTPKPEIYNYTNFDILGISKAVYKKNNRAESYYPYIGGTKGAAVNTAAAIADLLRFSPFLKWHPELVKARILTASTIDTKNTSHDVDIKKNPKYGKILDYPKLFDVAKSPSNPQLGLYRHYSRFWNGDLNTLMKTNENGVKEIKFTTWVFKDRKYRAAISWLCSGNDVKNLGRIPQDFDLYAYWNDLASIEQKTTTSGNIYSELTSNGHQDRNTYIAESTSENPFELIEFKASMTGFVTFSITLFRDSKNGENKGKMQLGFDLLEIIGE